MIVAIPSPYTIPKTIQEQIALRRLTLTGSWVKRVCLKPHLKKRVYWQPNGKTCHQLCK